MAETIFSAVVLLIGTISMIILGIVQYRSKSRSDSGQERSRPGKRKSRM